ncbi:general stress protein [Mycobacterium paraffinicum]|uniref:General stress protein n=1 Tax=Mycobacterium paraffinicum TaxID=53378 RepID=A0A1Q4HTE5_9MYCO|nr:aldo/keto reductase [Mycobacterium paraffinicum]OJZ72664.1 general stress protein [Mycobacterium paraffinicum]
MEQIELSGPALKVSAVGFGCGGLLQAPFRKERMAVLGSAVEHGITHFDTARMYGLGMAESELGVFLRTVNRDAVTVATKFGIEVGGAARRLGRFQAPARAVLRKAPALRRAVKRQQEPDLTPRRYDAAVATRSLDESLAALGVDYVDILFVHGPRPFDVVAGDELGEFFERAHRQGKIRAWGVSQDEGLEVDFAGAFAPRGVSQVRGDLLAPPPRPADLVFGVFNRSYDALRAALRADARLARRWCETLQADPLAPGVLPRLIVASSARATGCRAILYSSTDPRRVADAAEAVSSPPDGELLTRFLALARQFRRGPAA